MVDFYSQLQKKKEKSKEQDEADRLIQERQEQLERENYEMAKSARMKLEKTAQTQKGITTNLEKQGEQLKNAEKSGRNVHKNVRKGAQTTEKIKEEGKMIKIPFLSSIKKIFTGDKDEDEIIKKNKNKSQEKLVLEDESSEFERKSHDELISGEKKTDQELLGIYKTLRTMKNENIKQQGEINKQKVTMKNLDEYNKDSDAIITRTNKELKKL